MPTIWVLDRLRDEHRAILEFLRALELYADSLSDAKANPEGAKSALEFIDDFVEKGHHIREEHLLFRYLAENNLSMDRDGNFLIHCHDETRDQLEGMRLSTPPTAPEHRTAFVWNAKAYISLMREHIVTEETWLYPRIERALGPEHREALNAKMAEAENTLPPAGAHAAAVAEHLVACAREFNSTEGS
ncbi:MAG: hemerythrin domain-containing protein [Planctomycetes bacterium]|nr:hemerythrin domain-containing protein [Planctomycetota bacterium]